MIVSKIKVPDVIISDLVAGIFTKTELAIVDQFFSRLYRSRSLLLKPTRRNIITQGIPPQLFSCSQCGKFPFKKLSKSNSACKCHI